jgi:hypothetical protein
MTLEELIELRRRILTDPASVTDDDLREALQFARERRAELIGAAKRKTKEQKPEKKGISLEDISRQLGL